MNDLEYLNQISANVRPSPAPSSSLFGDKTFRLIAIIAGIVAFFAVLLMIITSLPSESTLTSELTELNLRSSSLLEIVSSYNSSIKSSDLRSAGASFESILTQIKNASASSLDANSLKSASLSSEGASYLSSTSETLESAVLNGLLDRYYASELSFHISHLQIILNKIHQKSSDSSIQSFAETSYSSLTALKTTFDNFNE